MPKVVLMGCGAFGKLASVGDFVRFDLPRGFVDAWDLWLQTEMRDARQSMQGRWQDCFFSAPIWRFSIAPDVAGGRGMLGILMASVDRVGRQFPLTLAMGCDLPHGAVHLNARATFEQLEEIALSTLEDLPLDTLKSQLADVQPPCLPVIIASGAEFMAIQTTSDLGPAVAAPHLTSATLWSARNGDGMLAMQGANLPSGAKFAALFDVEAAFWRGAA